MRTVGLRRSRLVLGGFTAYTWARAGSWQVVRRERLGGRPILAVAVAAFFLGAQHIGLPLRFDGAFVLWRLLMFMPFAFLLGGALRWRPRLLPYLMVVHGLLDLQAAWMVLAASAA